MPPFNLCYVTRIIELHGSCILHVCLDCARIFGLSTLLAVVLPTTLPEAPMPPFIATQVDFEPFQPVQTTMRRAHSVLMAAQMLSTAKHIRAFFPRPKRTLKTARGSNSPSLGRTLDFKITAKERQASPNKTQSPSMRVGSS
jgi:hypothetical protein